MPYRLRRHARRGAVRPGQVARAGMFRHPIASAMRLIAPKSIRYVAVKVLKTGKSTRLRKTSDYPLTSYSWSPVFKDMQHASQDACQPDGIALALVLSGATLPIWRERNARGYCVPSFAYTSRILMGIEMRAGAWSCDAKILSGRNCPIAPSQSAVCARLVLKAYERPRRPKAGFASGRKETYPHG